MSAPHDRFAEAERIVAHDGPHAFEAVVPPIVQTSLFTFATTADMVDTNPGGPPPAPAPPRGGDEEVYVLVTFCPWR